MASSAIDRVRRSILHAVGIGAAVGLAACAGRETVDDGSTGGDGSGGDDGGDDGGGPGGGPDTGEGSGGSGGGGDDGGETSSSETGGEEGCDPTPPPEGEIFEMCLGSLPDGVTSCADCDAACAQWWIDTTMCPGDSPWPDEVVCEPTENAAGECCVVASATTYWGCDEGRPFMVDGAARTAEQVRRADWCGELSPSCDGLSDRVRAALAGAWTRQALAEHASVASFSRFVMELLAVGAPPELIRDAQAAVADEVEHARACFAIASAYAGEPVGPDPLDVTGAGAAGDLRSIVLAAVGEGCIGETLAAIECRVASEAAQDPVVREALGRIADEENRHAELAWRFLRWGLDHDPALADDVGALFASAKAGAREPGPRDALDLRVHGQLGADERQRLLDQALGEAVLPCANALLARYPSRSSSLRGQSLPSNRERPRSASRRPPV